MSNKPLTIHYDAGNRPLCVNRKIKGVILTREASQVRCEKCLKAINKRRFTIS